MSSLQDLRLAVLVDADNIPRKSLKSIMEEIALYGTPTIKRIYGDWTSPNLASMKQLLLETALTPIQQYGYTVGKNSTDSAMIIDAMDILYADHVDGFCIVSSDSDFTRLATRLREAGKKVIGIGERKTPNPFIVACDKFIYVEVITAKLKDTEEKEKRKTGQVAQNSQNGQNGQNSQSAQNGQKQKKKVQQPAVPLAVEPEPEPVYDNNGIPDEVIKLIAASLEDVADDDGYAFLGELGNLLLKKQPDFDPRNFGFSKLTPLIKSLSRFEIDVRQTNYPHIKHIYVRDKLAENE